VSTPVIPEGLEPLAVWDVQLMPGYGFTRDAVARETWARKHLGDPRFIRRAAFYVLGKPFAVVTRYKRNPDGFKYQDPETGIIATEEPVIVPLAELPPAHLLH
jgi:hypothetical protein